MVRLTNRRSYVVSRASISPAYARPPARGVLHLRSLSKSRINQR